MRYNIIYNVQSAAQPATVPILLVVLSWDALIGCMARCSSLHWGFIILIPLGSNLEAFGSVVDCLAFLPGAARNPIRITDLPCVVAMLVHSAISGKKRKISLRPPHMCHTHHKSI